MDPIADAIERLRTEKTPEDRAAAARWLGEHGDARAFEALEGAVLYDQGTWYEEGGFADRIRSAADDALWAVKKLVARVEPGDADRARWRALLATNPTGFGHALDLLFGALGSPARPILDDACAHPDPPIRARAIAIRDGLEKAVSHEDEEVRLATMKRNPDGTSLYYEAMRRYPREPSAHVRRAIFDVWHRQAWSSSTISAHDAMRFLADSDDDIRKRIAQMVVDAQYVNPSNDGPALKELAREVLGVVPKPTNKYTALLLQRRAENAKLLADAVRDAESSGKEPFDWEAFRMSGARPHGEDEHRFDYYVMKDEIRTMAEYIAYRKAMDPWEDCR